MTPRSLFSIILKILGIFFIKDMVYSIPQIISVAMLMTGDRGYNDSLWPIGFALLQAGVFIYVSYFLMFRSHKMIDLFKLDQGFAEEEFAFQFKGASMYIIAITATGLYMLVREIPDLFGYLYNLFEGVGDSYNRKTPGVPYLVFGIARILLALLLIGERKRIAAFFDSREPQTEETETE